jgi:hypothetical protein
MGLLDTILEAGAILDWISPSLQILDQIRGMTIIDASVPGYTGAEIKRWLERNGIRCGHGMIVDNCVLLPVSDADATFRLMAGALEYSLQSGGRP